MWGKEPYEERQYQVAGRNLRGYKASFERAGYPVEIQPGGPGIYIMVVSLPASMPQQIDPYQLPPRRRHSLDLRQAVMIALLVCIIAGAGWLAYTVVTGGSLPWAQHANGEPVVEQVSQPSWLSDPFGAKATAAQLQDAADSVAQAVTMLMYAVGTVLLLGLLWLARGILGTLFGAVGGIVKMVRR